MVFGRKSVETGTREARVALNHSLDQLFEGKHIKLKLKPKKKKEEDAEDDNDSQDDILDDDGCLDIVSPVVLCSDPQEFVYKVTHDSNMDPNNTDIKIGADDGQGLFKINVQLLARDKEPERNCRAKYSEVCETIVCLEKKVNRYQTLSINDLLVFQIHSVFVRGCSSIS